MVNLDFNSNMIHQLYTNWLLLSNILHKINLWDSFTQYFIISKLVTNEIMTSGEL